MEKQSLAGEQIGSFLREKILDKNAYFIFPTDTVLTSWVENLICDKNSPMSALPLERFIAWDTFKREYLKATKEGFKAIPATLRKFFIQEFIAQNQEKKESDRLKVIINSKDIYAKNAYSFADWLCSNLPSLHYWKKKLDTNKSSYGALDDEDKDYLYLYESYKTFLEKNKLFEPNWIEKIEFSDSAHNFYIFYPELLEDFRDFEESFSQSAKITLCLLPQNIPSPKAYFYTDSRKELRQTILRIIELYRTKKADFSEISLTVPNIDVYRPYIEREFKLYNVPFVIKSGVALTQNTAAKFFTEINEIHSNDYSFDSVRALLHDETVPWKEEIISKKLALIREGNRMRCVLSFQKDIWETAFTSKIARLNTAQNKEVDSQKKEKLFEQIKFYDDLLSFYRLLKSSVELFFKEKSFSNILSAWNTFKNRFLKPDEEFDEKSNLILGRCIVELQKIIQLEKEYESNALRINSPFDFYIQELNNTKYQMQNKTQGVNIFPYRLSAAASFKYQFVIDSSQKNLEVPYKRLTFLNSEKRKKLNLIEEDKTVRATEAYIKLYAKKNPQVQEDFIVFSSAEQTFSGFAIPHSQLTPITEDDDFFKAQIEQLNQTDFILNERDFFLKNKDFPSEITFAQKEQFESWKNSAIEDSPSKNLNLESFFPMEEKIHQTLFEKRAKDADKNKMHISARGDLERFFPCPRRWILSSILHLHDDSLDTDLMKTYDMGNLNHKILELFASKYINKKLPFYDENSDEFVFESNDDFLNLNELFEQALYAPSDFRDSPLVTQTLTLQKEKITQNIADFLKQLLLPCATDKTQKFRGIGNCTVIGTEITLSEMDFEQKIYWYGKIDLLVKNDDEIPIIVDYKNTSYSFPTAKSMLPDDNGFLADFQMPLYTELIHSKYGEYPESAVFYAIKDPKFQVALDQGDSKKDVTACMEGLSALKQYALLFEEKINSKDFTPKHSQNEKDKFNVKYYEQCVSCNFKGICRTTYTIASKKITESREN